MDLQDGRRRDVLPATGPLNPLQFMKASIEAALQGHLVAPQPPKDIRVCRVSDDRRGDTVGVPLCLQRPLPFQRFFALLTQKPERRDEEVVDAPRCLVLHTRGVQRQDFSPNDRSLEPARSSQPPGREDDSIDEERFDFSDWFELA